MEKVVAQIRQDQDYVFGPRLVETDVLFEVIDVPSDRRDSLGSRLSRTRAVLLVGLALAAGGGRNVLRSTGPGVSERKSCAVNTRHCRRVFRGCHG